MFLEYIQSSSYAEIISISESVKTKRKPNPLNTIELQRLASKKLHFSPSMTMEIAERIYNKGYLSYPRTETNTFKNMDINEVIKELGLNRTTG